MDCGGHFRSYSTIAYLAKEYCGHFGCPTTINYFGEKHGKGLVDAAFATVNRWISSYLSHGEDRQISSLAELVRICQAAAAKANKEDDGGIRWKVLQYDSDLKPAKRHLMEEGLFQIQRTYCLRVEASFGRYDRLKIINKVFSDEHGGPVTSFTPKFFLEDVEDRSWRKGYFGNRNWERRKPQRGETTTLMSRRHSQQHIPRAKLTTAWQDRAARQARALERRRAARRRKLAVAEGAEQASSTSSSSSSESDSSSESS